MSVGGAELDVPVNVVRVLDGIVAAARESLGDNLKSVLLFGSAAEGRLRATSDVNLIVVLDRFEPAAIDGLRDTFRTALAAVKLQPMFLLASEVAAAAEAFSVKFADVLRRRRVLYGADPFAGVTLPRAAEIARLRQVLLNLALRLRQQYVLRSLREEQAALAVADAAGPLRACAAALLELRGQPVTSPKEALTAVAASLPGGSWTEPLARLSEARERRALAPALAAPTLLALAELASALRAEVEGLRP
jgi:predicted nucleotidyltransferase